MSFLEQLPPPGAARDAAILGAIATGHLDPVCWVPVRCGPVELQVSADWLSVEGGRVPMTPANAQAAVDSLEALLPTPLIVRAIETAARERGRLVPFVPWPRWQDNSQLQTSTILWREQNIPELPRGTLVAGALKDVVIAPRLAWMLDRVLIFGGLGSGGKRVQELQTNATAHGAYFDGGYAHGTRAVRDACTVDGRPARVSEILADPERGAWLSDEGPLSLWRYPGPRPVAPPSPAPPIRWTPAPAVGPLRRGHQGPRVVQLQVLLTAAGFPAEADGDFGRQTEARLLAFQRARGLVVSGEADEGTVRELQKTSSPEDKNPSPEERIRFVQARNYHPGRQRPIRAVVLHTAEIAEVGTAAENLAAWASGPSAPMASWHYCVDNDTAIQCVRDEDTAFAAPGANADGLQIEMSGRASQGAAGWADAYSQAVLQRTARLVANLCRRHGLPVVALDAAALQRGEAGITTHAAVTAAYRQSTHTDPGKDFPMAAFLELVRRS